MKRLLFAAALTQGLSAVASVPSVIPAGDIATRPVDAATAETTVVEGELRLAPDESERALPLAQQDGRGTVVVPSGSFSLQQGGSPIPCSSWRARRCRCSSGLTAASRT